ncbi:M3 family metallopeptidase [Prolixibacter denitrificans]|uniref:oligopeptidase A n=2 Tax=Prolixibacter denitrificans TaxID=1541063 RepID=A0ABQ0ZH89_9BACT|nr:M3 family metallopeptidase [Prolixibacter denitrificans]GET20595.1 dipeptidyl carboxypeptidase II [Prolixibacter denitrificans]
MKKTIVLSMMILFSIASSQGASDGTESNPLLMKWNTPHETAPFNLIKTENFVPAIDVALAEARKDVDAIINNPEPATFQNTIEALEVSGEQLDRVTGVLFNLNSAETNKELQAVAREVSPKLSEFGNYVSLNEDLFKRVKAVYDKRESLDLTPEQAKLLENSYKGFVRRGANLQGEAKKRYAEITTELAQLSLKFGENVLEETNAFELLITDEKDLSGLPEAVREAAQQLAKSKGKEGWMFNLQYPSYLPFMKYADNRELREKMYRTYTSRAFKDNDYNNEEIIHKIVNLRLEKANLLGFKSHADYVLSERMAETPEKVNSFLEELHEASKPYAEKEFKEVTDFAKANGLKGELQRWDWAYYSEKLKTEKFGFDEEEVKPYFQLEKVREGVFELAHRLYGLNFKENKDIQVYHPDVTAYDVFNEDGSFLSVLYLDFFPREGKRGGAWMNDFRAQSNINGKMERPIITVVTNFTKPTETKPSLLTFDEVETFLHEFGHSLHGMLANTVYPSMSGTGVYRDFVELPSQIMENWATEKEWLDLFAVHYQTGEKIPAELVDKLIKARNFQSGYLSERQLSFGMDDMAWHSITKPVTEDVISFERRVMDKTELFPHVDGSCFNTAFSHIFAGGYAAGYYGYKWAEVLDADAFSMFKKNGIFDKATAESFRKNILEKGGTQHPMELYKAFRGQEPTVDALLERSGLKE